MGASGGHPDGRRNRAESPGHADDPVSDRPRRKALRDAYRQAPPEAGVYLIHNSAAGKALLGSTVNLASLHNKLEFARATSTSGVLDHRLRGDADAFGIGVLSIEVLEVLNVTLAMTPAEVLSDLATLESLWREKLGPDRLYGR